MVADNDLDGAVPRMLDGLVGAAKGPEVAIFVQVKRKGGKVTRYRIHDHQLGAGTELGKISMGVPKALTHFVDWATGEVAADHVFLVISSHGAGLDDTPDPETFGPIHHEPYRIAMDGPHSLSDADFRVAIEDTVRGQVDVLGCDACFMGMIEIGYEMRRVAAVLLASEGETPARGWPYRPIVDRLVAKPSLAPLDFAKGVVDDYVADFTDHPSPLGYAMLAASDLTKLDAFLDALEPLATSLAAAVPTEGVALAAIRYATYQCGAGYVDFDGFVDGVAQKLPTLAAEVGVAKAALAKVCVAHRELGVMGATGLTIFLPAGATNVDSYVNWVQFARRSSWTTFVRAFVDRGNPAPPGHLW
jgi:hypothetical protein